VGLPLGCLLAVAARAGSRPRVAAGRLVRPALVLFLAMAAISVAAGFAGHALARAGIIYVLEPLASEIPDERHALLLAALCSHIAAYAAGVIGGLALCGWVYRGRRVGNAS
jgi:hypothetical protein